MNILNERKKGVKKKWLWAGFFIGALNALAAARAAGVMVTLDGGRLLLEAPDLPDDVVALLKANKPELLRILAGREAAKAALTPRRRRTVWRSAGPKPCSACIASSSKAGPIGRRS